ncbi:hypothetical protein BC831DRAFT_463665 [Entophlyctis helioformis]|nr:hypothetical protein BC831DRAFT_463665 [Entophlyctis helioformis]
MSHGTSLQTTVADWMEGYVDNDKVAAMHELVNFLIQTAGCTALVDRQTVEDPDAIADALEDIQQQYNADPHHEYPLALKGKGRNAAKFRKNFGEFWMRWVRTVNTRLLSQDDGFAIERLSQWLATMSSSPFRPFRHTATTVALTVVTGLCDVAVAAHSDWFTASQQFEIEQTKGKSARYTQVQLRVRACLVRKNRVETFMQDLYDGIFVHRRQDTDAGIRADCMRELGGWIAKYPDHYLGALHLRYLGWALSDKVAAVRLEALKALNRLYAAPALKSGLLAFSEKFKGRLVQMGGADKDAGVRHEAARSVLLLARSGNLGDEEADDVMPLLMDADPRIRETIAPAVADWWRETWSEPAWMDVAGSAAVNETVHRPLVDLKAMARLLIHVCRLVQTRIDETGGCRQAQASRLDRNLFPVGLLDDAAQQERDLQSVMDVLALQTLDPSHDTTNDGGHAAPLAYSSVHAAVSALWAHLPLLKDYDTMCEYLLADLSGQSASVSRGKTGGRAGLGSTSSSTGSASSISKSLGSSDVDATSGDRKQLQEALALSSTEETCLVYMLVSAVAMTTSEVQAAAAAPVKTAKTTAASVAAAGAGSGADKDGAAAARLHLSETLMRQLPLLIQKHAVEFGGAGHERLVELVTLVRSIHLPVYTELRQTRAFESLFDDLAKLLHAHHAPTLLREIGLSLRYLVGGGDHPATAAGDGQASASGKRVDAMAVAGSGSGSGGGTALVAAARAKLDALAERLFVHEIPAAAASLASRPGIDTLTTLYRTLARGRCLAHHVDLTGTDAAATAATAGTTETAGAEPTLGLVHDAINAVLAFMKLVPETAAFALDTAELEPLACGVLQAAIDVSVYDLAFRVKSAVDGGSGRHHGDADAEIEALVGQSDRLVTLCEAIAVGEGGGGDGGGEYPLSARWAAMRTLVTVLYPLLNGVAGTREPRLVRPPSDDVAAEMGAMVDRLALLATYVQPGERVKQGGSDTAAAAAATVVAARFRHEVWKTVDGLRRACGPGLVDRRAAWAVIKYHGVDAAVVGDWVRRMRASAGPTETESETQMRGAGGLAAAPVLGTVWTGLSTALVDELFGAGFQRVVGEYHRRMAAGDDERSVLAGAKAAVTGLVDAVLDSVTMSVDLFLTARTPSLDHTFALVKAVATHVRTWSDALMPPPAANTAAGDIAGDTGDADSMVAQTLLGLLSKRVAAWQAVHRLQSTRARSLRDSRAHGLRVSTAAHHDDNDDGNAQADGDDQDDNVAMTGSSTDLDWLVAGYGVPPTLAQVNQVWAVWSAVAAAVSHVVRGLATATSGVAIRETLVGPDGVVPLGVMVDERSADWTAYLGFVDTLQGGGGGGGVTRKRGGGATRPGTPAGRGRPSARANKAAGRGGGGGRARKARLLDNDSGEEDGPDRADATPRRRSARFASSSSMTSSDPGCDTKPSGRGRGGRAAVVSAVAPRDGLSEPGTAESIASSPKNKGKGKSESKSKKRAATEIQDLAAGADDDADALPDRAAAHQDNQDGDGDDDGDDDGFASSPDVSTHKRLRSR